MYVATVTVASVPPAACVTSAEMPLPAGPDGGSATVPVPPAATSPSVSASSSGTTTYARSAFDVSITTPPAEYVSVTVPTR